MLARKALAGTAGAPKLYVEDVFSTYLYTGTGSSQTITNNIDLSGKGGLVWIKGRSGATGHRFTDTARTATKSLESNSTAAEATESTGLTAFSGTGFTIGADADYNTNTDTYASWTFRKAEKFFDVVTYTGNGSARTISHNLGSTPGCIIVKRTDTTGDWQVYHRANTAAPETDYLVLNTTAATADSDTRWNDTLPTSTVFSLGTDATVNANNGTYVAYLFAHDAGGFGDAGDQSVIKCGSFTHNGTSTDINLGWEPQWFIIKCTDSTGYWELTDSMRSAGATGVFTYLYPGANFSESSNTRGNILATGLNFNNGLSSGDYIYIAIRRGPMKTPEAGTEVFAVDVLSSENLAVAGWPVDLSIDNGRTGTDNFLNDRLRGSGVYMATNSTAAETTGGSRLFDSNSGVKLSSFTGVDWMFRRAPGFFDVVCYTGTGSNLTVAHNLGVVPELMIIKNRSQADAWAVYAGDNTDYLVLNTTAATADLNTYWNDTSPTSTNFTVGTVHNTNASAENYVAYLFASLAGVSKVGTYTGNGSSVTVTTGFQPRFILVKRTDSTGNWIVGDSARGLVAGDDPFLLLNSSAAEDTDEDWVDVSATGFTVNETAANANVNTGTYIYLAIA